MFFDRNKDGYVSKDELVGAINEISPGKQGAKIGMQRFGELWTDALPCNYFLITVSLT